MKNNKRITSIASKITLWVGIVIILSSVGYAVLNLSNIDSFISTWATFMAIGVAFSFINILLNMMTKLSNKK
uniref:hypothetical protein n=1 Tax=uncultured Dysgonomonas sp. TaxID=206096 RepID=UPI00261F19EE|nr:hypothetical protein [uncultured Dysgonomonas sp.]